jgi:hypothetical protein
VEKADLMVRRLLDKCADAASLDSGKGRTAENYKEGRRIV